MYVTYQQTPKEAEVCRNDKFSVFLAVSLGGIGHVLCVTPYFSPRVHEESST